MPKTAAVSIIKTDRLTKELVSRHSSADALVILSKDYSEISVKDELSGKSEKLLTLGKLTKLAAGAVFIGFTADRYDRKLKSVAVFLNGRLVKIADETRGGKSGFAPSYGYKSVKVGALKMGVAVGKDVCDNACLSALTATENDVIINLSADFYDFSTENLISSLSYLYGTAIVSVNSDKSCIAANGKLILSTSATEKDSSFLITNVYKEVNIKQRGLY
ncbi:MAG: hypothetical protein J5762_00585 [Clostridia bacterium]|nr:hypothetical protein [Clostridia bacterium]